MKVCCSCGRAYPYQQSHCPACGQKPGQINGFAAYAPKSAEQGAGFQAELLAQLAALEEGHFWFLARNRLIIHALGSHCPDLQSFLEIGCGTGFVLQGIARAFPEARLHGSEISAAGLSHCAPRVPEAELMQMDARSIPFLEEFDAIGAFDVLEHIREDEQVLGQVCRALKPGGLFLLTVPQHQWLWSRVDESAGHVRRYQARELHAKLGAAGFRLRRSTSFVSLLLPLMLASRYTAGWKKNLHALDELRLSPLVNRALRGVMALELMLLRKGLDFPAGGSRLVVAQKGRGGKLSAIDRGPAQAWGADSGKRSGS